MEKRNLHLQKKVLPILLVLLLSAAGMTKGFAQNYDFSAVCETGQILYYNIINADNHYVEITCPGDPEADWDPYYGYYNTQTIGGGHYCSYPRPTGNITLPSTVSYNWTSYEVTAIGNGAFYV